MEDDITYTDEELRILDEQIKEIEEETKLEDSLDEKELSLFNQLIDIEEEHHVLKIKLLKDMRDAVQAIIDDKR